MKRWGFDATTYHYRKKNNLVASGLKRHQQSHCFIFTVVCSTVMIAVFCRYERDYKELEPTPRQMFKRIRSINDIRGIKFTGIIKVHDWYRGEEEINEAYDHLRIRQPELFE